ncbi:GNAT family N-acetyltransferase [Neosynechococcus sphagnicola]|uniref:GNAT family N-acetyltransferase n=1 Tax=Neosynechococcus sphagnicola TaxID=1501145 RepID=UPI00068F04C7|nr:GNAT family N-acetyltransferase [Neosynechococcus sphagnicola]
MDPLLPESANSQTFQIRPMQYRDLEVIEQLVAAESATAGDCCSIQIRQQIQQVKRWYRLLQVLGWFPNPWRYYFCVHVAEVAAQFLGMIQVSPVNRTRSTWRIDQVAVTDAALGEGALSSRPQDVGSQLLRQRFETVWEARTWVLEIDVNNKTALALYRQNGFQPLAHMTYWAIAPESLQTLAQRQPDLPNLLPVSNADAQLLYQLDTAAMPPLVRQVFDRHILDFKTSLFRSLVQGFQQWVSQTEVVSGYVFEPQRKAAIGYFQMQLCRNQSQPHEAQLTVHPAYTWLYPELMAQMARIAQAFPAQGLYLASADYQPEREAYLERIGASRTAHTLMMSRSVWHKLRESKSVSLDSLQLSEVLQSFQPVRKPIPSRIILKSPFRKYVHHFSSRSRCR